MSWTTEQQRPDKSMLLLWQDYPFPVGIFETCGPLPGVQGKQMKKSLNLYRGLINKLTEYAIKPSPGTPDLQSTDNLKQ